MSKNNNNPKKSFMDSLRENFNLNNATQAYFWKSEWEKFDPDDLTSIKISWLYLGYRFLFCLYFFTISIINILCDPDLYFIYLTNLSFTIQLIYAMTYFLTLIWTKMTRCEQHRHHDFDDEYEDNEDDVTRHLTSASGYANANYNYKRSLPIVYKCIWILHEIVSTMPYVVSIVYWIFLHKGAGPRQCENTLTYFLHGSNSIAALIDSFMVAIPIRLTHIIFPLLSGIVYILFSILYEIFNGSYKEGTDYIYPILDWKNNPETSALLCCIFELGAGIIFIVLCWMIYKLRVVSVHKFFA